LAEEQEWRADARRGRRARGWYPTECQWPAEILPRPDRLTPQEISGIYRSLRKGREDDKDAPGAADFYYGEMEMRRLDRESPSAERAILWSYWACSGYGLRASRPLFFLGATLLIFTLLFQSIGFSGHATFLKTLAFSAESTIGLFRAPPQQSLTTLGEWLSVGLRLLGPLFFGLALLSVRGRVKR
jgi:hypothetical protein